MIKFFNPANIKTINIRRDPRGFRFGFTENLFHEPVYEELSRTFPDVSKFKLVDKMSGGGRKRFYVGPVYTAGVHWGCICHWDKMPRIWREVLLESTTPGFVNLFRESTRINFNTLANFGLTYGNEGCVQEPHLDGAVREEEYGQIRSTIACLIYFNKEPKGSSGTAVYANDRKTILFQAPSMRNSLLFFEQHPEAWHGFPPVPSGEDRRLVSLAYGSTKKPINLKTSVLHKLTCPMRLKDTVKKFLKR